MQCGSSWVASKKAKPGKKRAAAKPRNGISRDFVPWQYAVGVVDGKIPASRLVRLSCERFLGELSRFGIAQRRGIWFDREAAERACRFFPSLLRHHKGEWAGQPFTLEPWQQFIVANVFGWRQADGRRRFRKAFIEIPRKNGKSQLAAGVGLLLLAADQEPGVGIVDQRVGAISLTGAGSGHHDGGRAHAGGNIPGVVVRAQIAHGEVFPSDSIIPVQSGL